MQRKSVLLPEPLLPMMAMTSPRLTSRSMPFSTSLSPKRLRSALTFTMGSGRRAAPSGRSQGGRRLRLLSSLRGSVGRDREAQREVHQRHAGVDGERLESRVGDHRAGLGQLDEADHRRQRRALDHLHEKAHRRRRSRCAAPAGRSRGASFRRSSAPGCRPPPTGPWESHRRSRARSRPGRRWCTASAPRRQRATAGTLMPNSARPK